MIFFNKLTTFYRLREISYKLFGFRTVYLFYIVWSFLKPLFFTWCFVVRSMVRIQKRIAVGMEVLQYFTTRSWDFKVENTKALISYVNADERDKFYIQNVEVDIENYMIQVLLGARQYCLKEPLTNMDRARYHLKL